MPLNYKINMEYNLLNILSIILLPLFAFFIGIFLVKRFTKITVFLSCFAIFGAFLFSSRMFIDAISKYSTDFHIHKVFTWFNLLHYFKVDMGIYLDNMSIVMLLMVTFVAFLIHLFSTYYMKDDKKFGRFFVYLSLFTAAMIGLVMSDNLLSMFIFWEIMGFCSYSLIGFYYEKEGAGNASIKAFMTTRVGDVFFLLGILVIWDVVGNVNFVDIYKAIDLGVFDKYVSIFGFNIYVPTLAGISIFLGTVGKSAQVPLQIWLPDAMWGPTPCSALIHAATMVAAGVFLSLRMFPLMELGGLLPLIAYVGAITAFLAATIALIQEDIKAVLAYSTISQLGYMILGLGVGAYNSSFMHLITHAVFKACLFLSAGSIIHSLHCHKTHDHVQDMTRMGGLRKKMPYTFVAMIFCTLAISGIPLFSGFVSKDRILGDALVMAFSNSVYKVPTLLGFLTAFLTAFYMFRMIFLTFFGIPKDKELYDHTKKEVLQFNRNIPLLILSIFTLGVFFSGSLTGLGLKKVASDKYEWFQTLIVKPEVKNFSNYKKYRFNEKIYDLKNDKSSYDKTRGMTKEEYDKVHHYHIMGAVISIIIVFVAIILAMLIYLFNFISPSIFVRTFSSWYKILKNKYYFDEFYINKIIKKVLMPFNGKLSSFDMGIYDRYAVDGWELVNRFFYKICNWFDNVVVDKIGVDGTGLSVKVFNVILRSIQTGKVQLYIVIIILVLVSYAWVLI